MRPNLDGADFCFVRRIGQAAKTGATNPEKRYVQKEDEMPHLISCDHIGGFEQSSPLPRPGGVNCNDVVAAR